MGSSCTSVLTDPAKPMKARKQQLVGNNLDPTGGVSLNVGIPISHPKMIIFSRKTHGFVGETHHFRNPPYDPIEIVCEVSNAF